jgi:hypothetical protein
MTFSDLLHGTGVFMSLVRTFVEALDGYLTTRPHGAFVYPFWSLIQSTVDSLMNVQR